MVGDWKMAIVERGTVRGRQIELPTPVALPDGTEVIVSIEPVTAPTDALVPSTASDEALAEFLGMWQGRDEMRDSAAWVREVRETWQRRMAAD
jgi:hypothetical protein